MIDIIETAEDLRLLKNAWERLEQNPNLRIFQTYAWCKTAWDKYLAKEQGNRLWILHWHQDDDDGAVIFPFYIDGKGCLRFIMDTHSDICDSVHSATTTNRHWAYKEAADEIVRNRDIKSVWLQKSTGASEALNYLSVLLPGAVVCRDNAFSWIIAPRAPSFAVTQDQLKHKERKKIKAIAKKSNDYAFAILSKKNGDIFPENAIKLLREEMIGWRRGNRMFFSDDMIHFVADLYDAGVCEIPILKNDLGVCALAFRLLKEGHINFWVVLYNNPHLSTMLSIRYIEAKVQDAAYVYDFGVGAYTYKLETYRPFIGVTFSLHFAQSWVRRLFVWAQVNIRLLKDMLKPCLKRH